MKCLDKYWKNKTKIMSAIVGQHTDILLAKLECINNFERINTNSNVIELLKSIHNVVFGYNSQSYSFIALYTSLKQ